MSDQIIINVNTCMMMGKIVSPIVKIGEGPNLRCEFDVETKRYTENASKPTIITCISEGKQAELVLLQKKQGDPICFSGYIGEYDEFGSKPGSFGHHKIRITRLHFEYINQVVYMGKISTQPYYDDRYETTEFFMETERFRNNKAVCRIRIICTGYNAEFLRVAKDVKIPGTYIGVLGELSGFRGEHVILASRTEMFMTDAEKAPIVRKLYDLQKKEVERVQESRVKPPAKPVVVNPGHAKIEPTPAGDLKVGDKPDGNEVGRVAP